MSGQLLCVDLKIQLTPDGVPRPLMDWLKKNGPETPSGLREGVTELIALANSLGLKVTVMIEQPGANA